MISPVDKHPEFEGTGQLTSKISSLNMPINMQSLRRNTMFFADLDLKEKSTE